MNRYGMTIGVLLIAVIGLAVGLTFALIDDGNGMHDGGDGYQGMMGAFAEHDTEEMLARMRQVLTPDEYDRMVEHIDAHKGAADMPPDAGMDQMMHRMMDGMMAEMPMDGSGMIGNR